MLSTRAVEPATLELLKALMHVPELADFSLVGGTALALRYGHRTSVDLDLFATRDFANKTIIDGIVKVFPDFIYRNANNPVGVFGYINEVKVDFVHHHQFRMLKPIAVTDGIRMFSDEDIMAMKIFAALQRAQKKDFWDIAEMLQHYPLEKFIACYKQKYPDNEMLISIPHALTYFTDAEDSETPVSLKKQTWAQVKKTIAKAVRNYLK